MQKYVHMYFTVVLHGPDNVTVCEGGSTTFTCVLDRSHTTKSGENVLLNSDNVKWHRTVMGRSSTETIVQGSNIHFTTSTNDSALSSSLTVSNANRSYTGLYFVGTPYYTVCRASLTVTTSM